MRDELARGTALLQSAGVDSPRLDAELLLAEATGLSRAGLVSAAREAVEGKMLARYEQLLDRRREREPIAYILGRREFRRLTLSVDRRVLIPRPETELLVEVGLELERGCRVADVGTGSGAVALALKDERPDLSVTGVDVDQGALEVARANGERLGLDVEWVCADLLDGIGSRADAVLANLPYVESGFPLAPEIALFEPAGALFAGEDGLSVVRRLAAQVAPLARVRVMALEVGLGQAEAVTSLLSAAGFASVESRRDLAGIDRVVVGRR